MAMTAKIKKNRNGAWDFNQFMSLVACGCNRVDPLWGKYPQLPEPRSKPCR